MFIEPGRRCDPKLDPGGCGAKLEVFKSHRAAARRAALLRSEGDRVIVRGAFLLRPSRWLPDARWDAYRHGFQVALDQYAPLSHVADTGSSADNESAGHGARSSDHAGVNVPAAV